MKTKYKDDMFIVINRKHIIEMRESAKLKSYEMKKAYETLIDYALAEIDCLRQLYKELTGKKLDQKYYVCNQDEPYADEVLKIIIDGESSK